MDTTNFEYGNQLHAATTHTNTEETKSAKAALKMIRQLNLEPKATNKS